MKIIIIGGGIAGLTAAIALKQKGYTVRVYERTAEWRVAGAGIVLAKNALAVFEKLNIDGQIVKAGLLLHKSQITDARFVPIQSINNNSDTLAIHRAALHQILLEQLDESEILLDKHFSYFSYLEDGGIKAYFEDESIAVGDCLIGADGIASKVRKQLFPEIECRDSQVYCWRATVDYELPKIHEAGLTEAWGGRARFGLVPLAKGKVYWFACYHSKKLLTTTNSIEELASLFSSFNPLVQNLIKATTAESVHGDRLLDIPQKKQLWYSDEVCLIGDAAHATTPNMGQGAGQAIEDAFALAQALNKYEDREMAFQRFQHIRQKKVNEIVQTSWRLGQLAHWRNPLLMNVRNALLRNIPASFSQKQFAQLFDISYIEQL